MCIDKRNLLHTNAKVYITETVSGRGAIKAYYLKRLHATQDWLNGQTRRVLSYHLPDGTLFPQPDLQEFREEVAGWVTSVIRAQWDLAVWKQRDNNAVWNHLNERLGLYRPELVFIGRDKLEYWFRPADDECSMLPSHWFVFADLLMNPEHDRLGRCDRCQKFYVSGGHYQKKRYCTRGCAQKAASTKYIVRRKREERGGKIALAERLLLKWKPRYGNWKRWIIGKARLKKPGLTLAFVTRAANKGDIVPRQYMTREERKKWALKR